MAKTVFRTNRGQGFLAGTFRMGFHGGGYGSVAQNVHDGDTVNVSSKANFAIRFLAIDTPEISYQEPGGDRFLPSNNQVFRDLLAAPFSTPGSTNGFSSALVSHIQARASVTGAENHNALAKAAEDKLEELIQADMDEAGADKESFQFFLAFAFEALDHFGRLLCYVHPDQANVPADQRKASYNQRILEAGLASPYFIFPNVDPFRARGSLIDAAFDATSPQSILAAILHEEIRRVAGSLILQGMIAFCSTRKLIQTSHLLRIGSGYPKPLFHSLKTLDGVRGRRRWTLHEVEAPSAFRLLNANTHRFIPHSGNEYLALGFEKIQERSNSRYRLLGMR